MTYGGEKEEFILEQYDTKIARGIPADIPYSLEHKPEIYLHLILVWLIFVILHRSRTASEFGIGYISIADMRSLFDEFQVSDPDTRLYYLQLLQALDAAYVSHLREMKK